jgi:DNA-binding FadR family transcriptional regulator
MMTEPSVLSPIAKTRAYEQAAEQIAARIREGAWKPGDRLPSERDLALQLGISRGSTGEAFQKNPDFHMAVASASGNAMIARIQRTLVEAELLAMRSATREDRTAQQAAATLTEHRRIYDAIHAGRPREAEKAAFDHLITSWMASWRGRDDG